MKEWLIPSNIKQLRGFLGITGYYRRFIRNYGVISKPLTELLKKGAFSWNTAAATTFQDLKDAMVTAPILSLPGYAVPFIVETDACGSGVGAVLTRKGRPVAFFSKSLGPKYQSMSTYKKELLAIVLATQKWHTYLQGNHFIIKTDHQSLKYLLEQRLSTILQQKWLKGKDNVVADALSRLHEGETVGKVWEMTVLQNGWVTEILDSYMGDSTVTDIISGIALKQPQYSDFSFTNGLLKYKGCLYVGNGTSVKQNILWELHDSPIRGHSGQDATFKRISQFFYWHQMKQEITDYVRACDTCQRVKSGNTLPVGLLQLLPVPTQIWEDISMDFVEGLPKSGDKDCIMVIIDRLTKVGHFIPLSHSYSATTIAQLFLDNVYKLHDLPRSIVSDRDKIFTIQFWKELFTSVGTKISLSTSYHPQTDGQTERLNR
ncbi:hypothetical protein DCAR_0205603 [Daucus carota subsp. sativus]|uniref:Integrase catalytic domain-containing protein n=1 Tax=Daucus carota subsp. sativus TaxID=79200 RepID=A0AAF1AND8_DAUCS|nr:hypothetical protein DCAR_0205603 [Daucus carota subsp. sativus]